MNGQDYMQVAGGVAALNKALGEAFADDPANAVRAHAAVLPIIAAMEWQPIGTAPEEMEVWVFDPDTDPQQYAALRTEGADGLHWRPMESLVAEMLDYDLTPTHWMPLPGPPTP